jgi:hypothetical protein
MKLDLICIIMAREFSIHRQMLDHVCLNAGQIENFTSWHPSLPYGIPPLPAAESSVDAHDHEHF